MPSVGIRELRQRASELLRRVEAGETFEVTDRGRPVAVLGPLPARSALERLRSSGGLESASAEVSDLPDPIELPRGQEAPSKVLERLRRDER
jgi:prevent-host-death family protein